MPGSWRSSEFPNLEGSNHEITSPISRRYNCIVYAAGEDFRVWWPDSQGIGYWPSGIERDETVEVFIQAYATIGYEPCGNGNPEPGIEKVALYAKGSQGRETPTHATLQLESGVWTSKLGALEDIEHSSPEDLSGPGYGRVVGYLSRSRS